MKLIMFFLLLYSTQSLAKLINDINIADKIFCAGQELTLKTATVREATIFNVNVYILATYAQSPDIQARPLCMEITYLKDFSSQDVKKAWDYQFRESADYLYNGEIEDLNRFKSFFSDIKILDRHRVELTANQTNIYVNGMIKGKIIGSHFGQKFLSMWFGKNPPTKKIKKDLRDYYKNF